MFDDPRVCFGLIAGCNGKCGSLRINTGAVSIEELDDEAFWWERV